MNTFKVDWKVMVVDEFSEHFVNTVTFVGALDFGLLLELGTVSQGTQSIHTRGELCDRNLDVGNHIVLNA